MKGRMLGVALVLVVLTACFSPQLATAADPSAPVINQDLATELTDEPIEEVLVETAYVIVYRSRDKKPIAVDVSLYGVVEDEPAEFRKEYHSRYTKAMIENPKKYNLNLADLMRLVDLGQYRKGRWRGFVITRVVFD